MIEFLFLGFAFLCFVAAFAVGIDPLLDGEEKTFWVFMIFMVFMMALLLMHLIKVGV
jgi:hypothetical protein